MVAVPRVAECSRTRIQLRNRMDWVLFFCVYSYIFDKPVLRDTFAVGRIMDSEIQLLNVPREASVRYKTNFIKTAVCELKFPILLELEEKLPIRFWKSFEKAVSTLLKES